MSGIDAGGFDKGGLLEAGATAAAAASAAQTKISKTPARIVLLIAIIAAIQTIVVAVLFTILLTLINLCITVALFYAARHLGRCSTDQANSEQLATTLATLDKTQQALTKQQEAAEKSATESAAQIKDLEAAVKLTVAVNEKLSDTSDQIAGSANAVSGGVQAVMACIASESKVLARLDVSIEARTADLEKRQKELLRIQEQIDLATGRAERQQQALDNSIDTHIDALGLAAQGIHIVAGNLMLEEGSEEVRVLVQAILKEPNGSIPEEICELAAAVLGQHVVPQGSPHPPLQIKGRPDLFGSPLPGSPIRRLFRSPGIVSLRRPDVLEVRVSENPEEGAV